MWRINQIDNVKIVVQIRLTLTLNLYDDIAEIEGGIDDLIWMQVIRCYLDPAY